MRVLLIEDDKEAVFYLKQALIDGGLQVEVAYDAKKGYEIARRGKFDVLIVDRLLPSGDGLDLIAKLRSNNVMTPALIVSALSSVDDKVKGLRQGGDDYLAKPYDFSELLARIEGLARRANQKNDDIKLKIANLELDRVLHKVWRDGEEIILQPREFLLLSYLMKNAGQIVTRAMLLENVWNYHFDPQTNVIDVHISRLRNKIELPDKPQLLSTVRGIGYRFNA